MKLFALKLFLGVFIFSIVFFISELPHIHTFFYESYGITFSVWEVGWSFIILVASFYIISFIYKMIWNFKIKRSTKLLKTITHNTKGWELARARITSRYIEILDREIHGQIYFKSKLILINYKQGLICFMGKNVRGNVFKQVRTHGKSYELTLQVESYKKVLSEL